jgi:trans-aconitate 2-methyltransferase
VWDPSQYLRYAGQRARPFGDLLARVGAEAPSLVVDLGCGPGNLTALLAERWPSARVVGVDSSTDMVERARSAVGGDVDLVLGDLRQWRPEAPVDVLVSNATLHWVPGHIGLLARFADLLAPGGWLAFQVPASFGAAAHVLLHEMAESDRWRSPVGPLDWPYAHEPGEYLSELCALGFVDPEVWETTYLHVLPGEDAVLDWMVGTAARPVLDALDDSARAAFLTEYGAALRVAYPPRPYGTVLPYRRVFAVARRGA